jgi:hypothetical protein
MSKNKEKFNSKKENIESFQEEENESFQEEENDETFILMNIEEKTYEACIESLFFIKKYIKENAIPIAENINYSDIYEFINIFDD